MNPVVEYGDESQHFGDNNFTQLTSLETAIEQIKKTWRSEGKLIDILEDLADYITQNPDRVVIGLEKKLELGKRSDLFARANFLKNKFARRVAKNQMSYSEQLVYIQILSAINTTWYQNIHPKIILGLNNSEIGGCPEFCVNVG